MTSALTVKKALIRAFTNHNAFKNRQCVIAHPGSEMEQECVFIDRVRNNEQARALGKAHRREELTVDVAIVSQVYSRDLLESEERAFQMLAGVEEAIAADSSLDGRVLIAEVTGWEQRSFNTDQSNIIEITVSVRVLANKDLED